MRIAAALLKPERTGWLRKFVSAPSRAAPIAICIAPTDERGGGGEREVTCGAGLRQFADASGDEQRDHRDRPDRHKPAAAEQRIDRERQQARIQSDLRRQPGEQRVSHALRDEQRGDDHARERVAGQMPALVTRKPVQRRDNALQPRHVFVAFRDRPSAHGAGWRMVSPLAFAQRTRDGVGGASEHRVLAEDPGRQIGRD